MAGRRAVSRHDLSGHRVDVVPERGGELLSGTALNVSEEGLAVALPGPSLSVGDRCRTRIHLFHPHPPLSLQCEVAWTADGPGGVVYGFRTVTAHPDPLELVELLRDGGLPPLPDRGRRRAQDRRHSAPQAPAPRPDQRKTGDRRRLSNTQSLPPRAHRLKSATTPVTPTAAKGAAMADYPLLIGGRSVRCERVDYFIPTDRWLADPRGAGRALRQLRQGDGDESARGWASARYHVGDARVNAEAMRAAHEAGRAFSHFSLARRRRILGDVHDLIQERKRELIDLMVQEGHPVRLAEWEYKGMVDSMWPVTLDFYKSEMNRELGRINGETITVDRKADGVVCVFPPKNAPCSVSLFAAFCLLPGNALIIKPPSNQPVSCSYLWRHIVDRVLRDNGAPPGTVNVVAGSSDEFLRDYLDSRLVNDIFYFGDSRRGLEIGARAYQHGKKPILELSGNDFMVVWEDAPLDRAVDSLLEGFLGSMQVCMAPKKALIHPAVWKKFVDLFIPRVESRVRVGYAADPRTYLTPLSRMEDFQTALIETAALGGRRLTGGRRLDVRGEPDPRGVFGEATVFEIMDENPLRFPLVSRENFFPILPLLTLPGGGRRSSDSVFRWMIDVIENNEFGLRTSVWTRSRVWVSRFVDHISSNGIVRINCPHSGVSPLASPNGGCKLTGGPLGEMNYPWLRSSHLRGLNISWPVETC